MFNILEEEIVKIFWSFRNNLKYYKFENGEFLDLEDDLMKDVLILLDNLFL